MHKKSVETTHTSDPLSSVRPPVNADLHKEQEEQEEEKKEQEQEEARTRGAAESPSRDELRENSVAALRAKARQHRVRVLGCPASGRVNEEEDDEHGP